MAGSKPPSWTNAPSLRGGQNEAGTQEANNSGDSETCESAEMISSVSAPVEEAGLVVVAVTVVLPPDVGASANQLGNGFHWRSRRGGVARAERQNRSSECSPRSHDCLSKRWPLRW